MIDFNTVDIEIAKIIDFVDIDFSKMYPNLTFPEGLSPLLPSRSELKHFKRVENRQKLHNKLKKLGRKL